MTKATLACALLLLRPAQSAETGLRVMLVIKGASVELSDAERSQIARRTKALMIGCGITSVRFPGLYAERSPHAEWLAARAGPHLYVRFSEPLLARRGGLTMSEVVIGLQEPNLVGPELSRHGDEVVGHGKCDGHRALALMCATALRHHLLPGQRANCAVYDRAGEPREDETFRQE